MFQVSPLVLTRADRLPDRSEWLLALQALAVSRLQLVGLELLHAVCWLLPLCGRLRRDVRHGEQVRCERLAVSEAQRGGLRVMWCVKRSCERHAMRREMDRHLRVESARRFRPYRGVVRDV